MKFYNCAISDIFTMLKSSEDGLSSDEAKNRLLKNGFNELAKPKGKSIFAKFADQIIDPMIIILLVAAAISAVLAISSGDSFAEVIIILAVVVINAVLGVYQETKAEAAIDSLKTMSGATAKVLRDGNIREISTKEIVVGDLVLLEAGDQVPADGMLFESASLTIEESALTGESIAVSKAIETMQGSDVVLADRKNMAYSGTNVAYGRGKMVVCATGMQTEIGKIASALNEATSGATPLQIKMAQLSKILTWVVLGISAVVFAAQIIRLGSLEFTAIINSLMIAVTLAVAAIPEGLAAIVTIVLSIGVTRMSQRGAIIRKLTAVETLGCAQIICSDKTGTLTQNRMTVVDNFGDEKLICACMNLCCDAKNSDGEIIGEPTEVALVR